MNISRERVDREASAEPSAAPETTLIDLRFRALLPAAEWDRLPPVVRKRFSRRAGGGKAVVYTGEVVEAWMSRAGWLMAQAARLIGAPLPTARTTGMAAIVTVTEEKTTGGQIWTRIYAGAGGFPQIIQSSKRFAGPTGLEEYIGYRLGMALSVDVEGHALAFRSAGYFLQLAGRRFRIPGWLTPGRICVRHQDIGDGRFEFTLEIEHIRLGLLLRQKAVFKDTA